MTLADRLGGEEEASALGGSHFDTGAIGGGESEGGGGINQGRGWGWRVQRGKRFVLIGVGERQERIAKWGSPTATLF